jgi:polar amino acid transport system substrate-binding protein
MKICKFFDVIGMGCLVVALLAGCSAPTAAAGGAQATSASATAVVVGTDATFPPFESLDAPRRTIVGFDIDLINAVAARGGFQVTIQGTRYGELLRGLATCEYAAGISAIPISEDLQGQMLFSEPYFVNGQVVVVKQGNIHITGSESLAGASVGVQKNTNSALVAGGMQGLQLTSYPTADFAFEDLAEGLIDAVVADKLLALSYVSVKPNNIKIVGEEFAADRYGIAVCSQQEELLKKINAGLAKVKADGTLEKLVTKWLTTLQE